MFRLVLTRLLVLYVSVILVIMTGQAFVLGKIYELEYRTQQALAIQSQAAELATLYTNYIYNTPRNATAMAIVAQAIMFTSTRYDATVWLVTENGAYEETSTGVGADGLPDFEGRLYSNGTMTQEEMRHYLLPLLTLGQKQVVDVGSFLGRFGEETLTVGYPCAIDGDPPHARAAIFIHSRVGHMAGVVKRVNRQIATTSLLAVVVGMAMVAWAANMFSRPLRQMSAISKEIARGNFDRRADVTSNDEIGQLADSFNFMAEELKKQEALRQGFVANVSHELRSPMTSIQGFAQGMLDGTIPKQQHERYLGIIVGETRRLNKLIRELLDLSQIESGSFPLQKQAFDINERIRLALIGFADRAEEKNLHVQVSFEPERALVFADPDRIEQVLVNLLDNAVKYTNENGTLIVWSHAGADRVLVGIKDDGPGIPPEDQPNIWERFYKVDKSHSDKRGTGLGLSIVKRIIDQHGERITLKSAPGEGTTFVFSLTKAPPR